MSKIDLDTIKKHIEELEKELKLTEINYHRLSGALASLKKLVAAESEVKDV